MIKKHNTLFSINKRIYISLFLVLLFSISVGYAALNSSVNVTGTASVDDYNNVFIESVKILNQTDVTENSIRGNVGTKFTTSLLFGSNLSSQITYEIVLVNGSSDIKRYVDDTTLINSAVTYSISNNLHSGVLLAPDEKITFTITYSHANSTSDTYNISSTFNFEDVGDFYAYTNDLSADLTTSSKALISLDVDNKLDTDQTYSLFLSDDRFELVDESNNMLNSYTIKHNSFEVVNIYIRQKDTDFYIDSYKVNLIMTHGSDEIILRSLDVSVTPNVEDLESPNIGPVSIDIQNDIGTLDVNFSREDSGGTNVLDYVILLYDSSDNLISTTHTNSDIYTYRFNNMEEKTYYAVVYGIDELNSGESYCSSATTSSKYCRKSSNTIAKWVFSVTNSLSSMSSNGSATVNRGTTYTATLSPSSSYSLPSTITVTMDGSTLTSGTDYTYSSSNGSLSIPNVIGNITITGTATWNGCLIEGTKILLYDGTYKNIEDVNYYDLLAVMNYETGKIDYEYPIWIEKKHTTNSYQLTSFSDGTSLKTKGFHGVFSYDANKFVSVDDYNNFKVGTRIIKIKDSKPYTVTVTGIKTIYDKVNYYHVVSTRFYNVIANDVLTTDGNTILSNIFGFNNNLTWKNKSNSKYTYDELNVLPYYMYIGLRAYDAKNIVDQGYMTKDILINYFINSQVNKDLLLEPFKDSNNNNLWIVSTDKTKEILKEGSIYKLPSIDNESFIGWYNSLDGQIYQANDNIVVYTSMYFTPIYK